MPRQAHYHNGKFPPKELDWPEIIPLIGPASASLARYDGTLGAVPNASVLLTPLLTQEAVLSSRIEGTQATIGEVLKFEAESGSVEYPDDKRNDMEEILNYRNAMMLAESMLERLPLCQRVIKAAHAELLKGVRGQHRAPGEYRRVANWIGPPGCSRSEARYVPISPDSLQNAMDAWERYIHEDSPDRLVKLAIIHAEFEALHPFLDGNGRLGRMLIPLFMEKSGLIRSPMFYISAYFERNRDEYYRRLMLISSSGDWSQWVIFFLNAVLDQARENQHKAEGILDLYATLKDNFHSIVRSQFSIIALDFIFQRPIFRSTDFTQHSNIPSGSAYRLLKAMRANEIIKELRPGSGRRAGIYWFPALLSITED